jgi:hypothetical protein
VLGGQVEPTHHSSIFKMLLKGFYRYLIVFAATLVVSEVSAQSVVSAIDSLSVSARDEKEILRLDSLAHLNKLIVVKKPVTQLASMREIDLNNDGKTERLRLVAHLKHPIDESEVVFTITNGKKTLFKDAWKAKGYFDAIDHLPDSIKLKRLSRIVNVFFANENFVVVDSLNLPDILKMGSMADVRLGSSTCSELMHMREVMFSAFRSREYWYGLMWLPSRNKLIKAWRN